MTETVFSAQFDSGIEDIHDIISDHNIYVEKKHLQAWASETEILFMVYLLKTDICIFLKAVNDLQVHSEKLLQPDLQILY